VTFPRVAFLSLLLAGLWVPAGRAAESDLKEPYQLHIVVHVTRHRLLTKIFEEQVAREVGDGLQAALGELASVKVVRGHPLLEEIDRQGLERALQGYTERSNHKTHFVVIDYVDGHYDVQARQYDGVIGLPGPVVRRDRTRDRAFVARVAALLVERDLGLLGTISNEPDDKGQVRVDLKGGGLGVPLNRWVKKGAVFGLAQVPPTGSGHMEEWALLEVVEPADHGWCTCKLFRRYKLGSAAGMRCVLLGTVRTPLHLRLVQEEANGKRKPLDAVVQLEIRRHGFEGENGTVLKEIGDGSRDLDTTSREGGLFDRVAFVSVVSDDKPRARIPIALVDDRLIVVPVPPAAVEDNIQLGSRLASLRRNVFDSYLVQTELFKEINTLTSKPDQRARALARVRETLERCQADYSRLSGERDLLSGEIAKLPEKDRPNLSAIDERLKQIKAGEKDLRDHVEQLEKIDREENDPKRKKWLADVERAKLLEKEAELGQAIALYEEVLKGGFESEELKSHLEKLKKLWQTQGATHAKARDFIYQTWPKLRTDQLPERIKEAQSSLAECIRVNDHVGAVRFQKGTQTHMVRLVKELEALKPQVNIDDEKPAKVIQEVAPHLEKLDADIRAFLERGK
jgi:hypothetical protein